MTQIIVRRDTRDLIIRRVAKSVVIRRSGIPGPAGGGAGSITPYEHVQSVASASWTVNHNLGRWPAVVTVLSPGRVEVEANVINNSVNQVTISFATPFAGLARIL